MIYGVGDKAKFSFSFRNVEAKTEHPMKSSLRIFCLKKLFISSSDIELN